MINRLKENIAAGKTSIGGWLTVRSEEVAEAMATLGFEWIVVDMEHGSSGLGDAGAAFLAIERHGATPLARLPSHDATLGRRLLDNGARGLIVPVVEDPDAFAALISRFYYPPHGTRGVGLGRFNRWGDDFESYLSSFEPLIVPMIETRRGVEAADAIAAIPEVDALFFGPYDLSNDLGTPGDFQSEGFRAAVEAVKDACSRHGKALGIHQVAPDAGELRKRIEQGFRFIAFGTDIAAMRAALAGAAPWLGEPE